MAEYFLDRMRSARAAWYRTARIGASPHLEMPPFLSVSPEAYFFGVSSHAWYGHQAAAGRAFANHFKHHFVKDSALLPKGSTRDEHGAHHRLKVRRLSYQRENAAFKWAGGDCTSELDPKYPQGSADFVFNVNLLALQRPSVREQPTGCTTLP
jgi:hypothetical protein